MKQLESNIMHSFKLAKRDIIQLQTKVIELSQQQEKILQLLHEVVEKESKNTAKVTTKTASKTSAKTFIAAADGSKFHIPSCPYAKNILPKHKKTFKSKNTALNQGFKACSCVK